jgi:PIN domain nuclease of toxin-antitoxin system
MSYLIDTQAFIWYALGDAQLSSKAKSIIESNDTRLISIATIWEMGIKVNIGKLTFKVPFDELIQTELAFNQYELLPIELNHIFQLSNLPHHHRDPFDRILIAQAISENIPIVSIDVAFDSYNVNRIW